MSKFQDVARESFMASSHWKWIPQPRGVRNEIRRTRKIVGFFRANAQFFLFPKNEPKERLKIELDGIFSGHFCASLNWFSIFFFFSLCQNDVNFYVDEIWFQTAKQKILIRRQSVECQLWWASNRQSTLLINDGERLTAQQFSCGMRKKILTRRCRKLNDFFSSSRFSRSESRDSSTDEKDESASEWYRTHTIQRRVIACFGVGIGVVWHTCKPHEKQNNSLGAETGCLLMETECVEKKKKGEKKAAREDLQQQTWDWDAHLPPNGFMCLPIYAH